MAERLSTQPQGHVPEAVADPFSIRHTDKILIAADTAVEKGCRRQRLVLGSRVRLARRRVDSPKF